MRKSLVIFVHCCSIKYETEHLERKKVMLDVKFTKAELEVILETLEKAQAYKVSRDEWNTLESLKREVKMQFEGVRVDLTCCVLERGF